MELEATGILEKDGLWVNINKINGKDLYKSIRENMTFSEVMTLYKCLKDEIEDRYYIEQTIYEEELKEGKE